MSQYYQIRERLNKKSWFWVGCPFFYTFHYKTLNFHSFLDDILQYSQSRLRSHPTSLCLVALAASDLVFCLYNLPLTAYQVLRQHVAGCDEDGVDHFMRISVFQPWL